ncbi:restriction endonuclease [Neobacillus sp. PS2-9]|uniref:restriction endonuclease n=1 Tax=Neobacillus sp. PS2-9 TaxID=3070676 RepID=UPI0027E06C1B|nr:restriction endonuclease [Neobacillus sp. PS2-9]WML57444.1 restriction endonuclease [Neobacillus sp. PS2-9]
MLISEILIAILLALAFVHFQLTKRKNTYQTSMLIQHIDSSEEMKKTLAMGLYLRFKKENQDNPPNYSSIYIKEDPLVFELFVADVIQKIRGGSIWVSPPSGDFGVDFEHTTDKGMFLGQVKCYQGDLPFDPIALIHSNMIKKGAVGGYVITTGSFTPAAREYTDGLNIELIDGVKLVELWINGLVNVEEEIKKLIPEFI